MKERLLPSRCKLTFLEPLAGEEGLFSLVVESSILLASVVWSSFVASRGGVSSTLVGRVELSQPVSAVAVKVLGSSAETGSGEC